ncbi:MAG: hypothetical protein KDA39_05475, partial [Hyphomonas sp.]|nr:hypothetical protein [Hyphomonas sp.]
MKWEGGRRGGNIEDRRGLGPGAVAGGGVGAVVLALIAYFFFGVSPEEAGLDMSPSTTTTSS